MQVLLYGQIFIQDVIEAGVAEALAYLIHLPLLDVLRVGVGGVKQPLGKMPDHGMTVEELPEQAAIGIILSESMRYLSAGMWWSG